MFKRRSIMNKRLFFLISLVLVLCLASSASAAMIGWWTFDDSDATDSGPGSHHGTLEADGGANTVSFVFDVERDSNVAYFPGDANTMINLGGGRTDMNDPCTWADIYGDQITMALWLKVDGLFHRNYECAFAKEDNYKMSRHGSTRRTMRVYLDDDAGGTFGGSSSGMIADDGQWHHFAAVYNGTTLTLYWDGEINNWENQSGNIGVNAGTTWDVTIGNNQEENDRGWEGWIDDVRLYDNAFPHFIVRTWAGAYATYNPVPVDGASYQEITLPEVSWTGMGGTTNYRLYLGTSFTDVNTGAAGVDKGEIPGITMNYSGAPMGGLAYATTYYWKTDSNRGGTVYPGDVWEFTTTPAWTEDPSPWDGCKYVDTSQQLSWTLGAGAIETDVYFSDNEQWVIDACDSILTNIAAPTNTHSPALAVDTTYYWRADSNTGTLYSVGNVWSFSTDATSPEPGLVGYWSMEDEGDLTWDISGNIHHGTVVAVGPDTVTFVYDANRGSNVAYFAGANSVMINCGGGRADNDPCTWADIYDNTMTMALWLKTDGEFDNRWASAFCKEDNWKFSRHSWNRYMRAYFKGAGGTFSGDTSLIADDGEWHHLAATYDGNEIRLYWDGAINASEAQTDNLDPTTWNVTIGNNEEEWDRGWKGWIDDAKLYDIALPCWKIVAEGTQCATAVGDLDANSVINLDDLNTLVGDLTWAKLNCGDWLITKTICPSRWKNCSDMDADGDIDLADLNRMVGNLTWEEITMGYPGTWSYPAGKYCP